MIVAASGDLSWQNPSRGGTSWPCQARSPAPAWSLAVTSGIRAFPTDSR